MDAETITAVARILALLIGIWFSLKVKDWLAFSVLLLLEMVAVLNSVLQVPNVVTIVGTPFTFLLVFYVLRNINERK